MGPCNNVFTLFLLARFALFEVICYGKVYIISYNYPLSHLTQILVDGNNNEELRSINTQRWPHAI